MNLDYASPDIVWKKPPAFVRKDGEVSIYQAQGSGRRFRVFARRSTTVAISIYGGPVWVCIQSGKPDGNECGYSPGTEEYPPLPGQRCLNCGNLRAEWVEEPPS